MKRKRVFIVLVAVLCLAVLGRFYLMHKINHVLSSIPFLEYQECQLNIFDASIHINKVKYQPDRVNYQFQIKEVCVQWFGNRLLVDSLKITPQHNKLSWAEQFQDRKARLDFSLKRLIAKGVNFKKLRKFEYLAIDTLILEKAGLEVFIDKAKPLCNDCYKAFPHEQLKNLPFLVAIDKVEIKDSRIDVEIKKESSMLINFEKLYASIYDISNDSIQLKQSAIMTADVTTQFLGSTPLDVSFNFDLNDPKFSYGYDASIGEMKMKVLNKMVGTQNNILIESGHMKSAKINVSGNNHLAEGKMEMDYSDLSIQMMKEERKPKKLISALVNTLLLKKDNQVNDKGYEQGKIYYIRESNRSLYHQWAHTAITGVKSILFSNMLLDKTIKSEKEK